MSLPGQALIPIIVVVTLVIVGITMGIVTTNSGPRAQATPPPSPIVTARAVPVETTTAAAVAAPTATPAPVHKCAKSIRSASPYKFTLIFPSGKISWNISPTNVTQTFLNNAHIPVDPITSIARVGNRYLVSLMNDRMLYKMTLDGMALSPIAAWQFENVRGFVVRGADLYLLSDGNELIKVLIGDTYAIIVKRVELAKPAVYIAAHPTSNRVYALLKSGIIALLDLESGHLNQTCMSTELRETIGFNARGQLTSTGNFHVETFLEELK